MSSINSRVPPLRLMAVDTPSDGQVASYQSSSGKFEWVDSGSGGDTYTIAAAQSGSDAEIQLDATAGTDSAVKLAAGSNITLTESGGDTITIASTQASGANPTATVSGSAVNGTATTFMRSDAAPALANTTVTPGSYTYSSITVDAQGRITAASSGTAPAVDGSGAATQVTYWSDADTITGSNNLTFDGTNLDVAGYVKSGTGVYDTDGATDLTLQTNGGTNSGTIIIRDGAAQDIEITPNGAGVLNLDGLKWPTSDGSANQVLATDGLGTLSFTDAGGGSEFNLKLPGTDTNSGNNDLYLVSRMPGWGSNYNGSGTLNSDENPYFWPWISPVTGNITCCIDVTFDGTGTLAIAIYTDENGVPKTKIGGNASYVFGSTGTGFKELSFSSAVSVTRGTQYWIGIVESTLGNGAIRSENGTNSFSASPRFNSPSNLSSVTSTGVSLSNSDNTLPSSITPSDLESNSRGQPRWGVRV